MSGVDDDRHGVAEDSGVFGVEREGTVNDIDEELDVVGVGKVAGHGLEHSSNQPDPVELVHDVKTVKFLLIINQLI